MIWMFLLHRFVQKIRAKAIRTCCRSSDPALWQGKKPQVDFNDKDRRISEPDLSHLTSSVFKSQTQDLNETTLNVLSTCRLCRREGERNRDLNRSGFHVC